MASKAFVSSTFDDLKEHRRWVIAALRKAGIFVDPMEEWTAATDPPKQFSQDRLAGCDLCVLLVGFRRGHIPTGESLSITQLEYRAAKNSGLDALVFLLSEDAPWPRKFDEIDSDEGIRRCREELKESKGIGFFGLEPESIEIAPALTRWFADKHRAAGSSEEIRERVTLLKWLNRIPQQFDDYFRELWRLDLGQARPSDESIDQLDRQIADLMRFYRRIVDKLPVAFEQTRPGERERTFFDEVFPSFQRRAQECFKADRMLKTGVSAPIAGGKWDIPFSEVYLSLDVLEHLRVLRLAAGEIVIQFPVDEVEQARKAP